MKIYLMKADSGNKVIFYEVGYAKSKNCEPSGKLGGLVDICAADAAEKLKKYFAYIGGRLEAACKIVGICYN